MEFTSNNPILNELETDSEIESVEVSEGVVEDLDRLFSDEVSYRTVDLSRASYICLLYTSDAADE